MSIVVLLKDDASIRLLQILIALSIVAIPLIL